MKKLKLAGMRAGQVEGDAQRAWDEGHQFFVFQMVNQFVAGEGHSSLRGVAEALEAAARPGWSYHSSEYFHLPASGHSWTIATNQVFGVHTFRRPPAPPPARVLPGGEL